MCTVLEHPLVDEHAGDCVSLDAFQRECVRELGEPVGDDKNEAVAIFGLRGGPRISIATHSNGVVAGNCRSLLLCFKNLIRFLAQDSPSSTFVAMSAAI